MKQYRSILWLIALIIAFSAGKSPAQYSGEIRSVDFPGKKVFDLGPCLIGDSLRTRFFLKNTGTLPVDMYEVSPSFVIFASPIGATSEELLSFSNKRPGLPTTFQRGASDTMVIQYDAKPASPNDPLGRKEIRLQLALVKASDTSVVVIDTFLIKTKKTIKIIDGFEDEIRFDSVYINPAFPPSISWHLKSMARDSIGIFSQSIKLVSAKLTDQEIIPEKFQEFPVFNKKFQTIEWPIIYYPRDTQADTAIFSINFHPVLSLPDSVTTAFVRITGIGCFQKLGIRNDKSGLADTLDLGDLTIGEKSNLTAIVKNMGNIPFGTSIQKFLNLSNDNPFPGFAITTPLASTGKNIIPGDESNLKFSFIPVDRGTNVARLIIESDIFKRNISSAPLNSDKVTFYVKWRGVGPRPEIAVDTIDFGNVYNNIYCSSTRDTTMFIKNTGNSELKVKDIVITDIPERPGIIFSTDTTELSIVQGTEGKFKITFNPTGSNIYTALMKVVTNAAAPNDTLKVYLKATSVPQVTSFISIDTIRSAPGRIIAVPIIVRGFVSLASKFDDTLYYDNSILSYFNYSTIGTASEEPMARVIVQESTESGQGKLGISLIKPDGQKFLQRDKLIILYFRTFLGERISTKISFTDPKFADEFCSSVLNIQKESTQDGYFITDSVCGLEHKAFPTTNGTFVFQDISPNPASGEILVAIENAFKTQVSITIYNAYGLPASVLKEEVLPAGVFEFKFPVGDLMPGAYYVEMKAGIFREMKRFVITR